MLTALSHNRHRHLIKILGTYKFRGQYHLMFPYANSNLRQYWEQKEPRWSQMILTWALEQMNGIASALNTIHNFHLVTPSNLAVHDSSELDPFKESRLTVKATAEERFGRHGDLKPENILWSEGGVGGLGVLQIADLGLGRFHTLDSRSRVDAKSVGGSPTYVPPELALDLPISRAYDIWSLGCVFLEFVTWLLGGWKTLEEFGDARLCETHDGVVDNSFFMLALYSDTGKYAATLRPAVRQWISDLHTNRMCSPVVHDILDLIEKEMLVINAKDRIASERLSQKLRVFVKRAAMNEEYVRSPPKRENSKSLTAELFGCEIQKKQRHSSTQENPAELILEDETKRRHMEQLRPRYDRSLHGTSKILEPIFSQTSPISLTRGLIYPLGTLKQGQSCRSHQRTTAPQIYLRAEIPDKQLQKSGMNRDKDQSTPSSISQETHPRTEILDVSGAGSSPRRIPREPAERSVIHKHNSYVHKEISYNREIRILTILHGPPDAPLECVLSTIPSPSILNPELSTKPKPYEFCALSYYWGQDEPRNEIKICNGIGSRDTSARWQAFSSWGTFYVRDNLKAALRQLRDRNEDVNVWVDAICINQDNKNEIAAQVVQMHAVYSEADYIIVWLGPESRETKKTFHFLRSILNRQKPDRPTRYEENLENWMLVENLIRNTWFSRLCVFQELALTKRVYVRWGEEEMHWNDFTDSIALFAMSYASIMEVPGGQKISMDVHDPPANLQALYSCAFSRSACISATSNFVRKSEEGWYQTLRFKSAILKSPLFLAFEATTPKDTIYALLALAKDTSTGLYYKRQANSTCEGKIPRRICSCPPALLDFGFHLATERDKFT
jgi:serine/threonine protein kinase